MQANILCVFVASFLLCLLITPIVRQLARRFGLLDHPDGARKLHDCGTPLGGGIAIFLSACAILMVALAYFPDRFLVGNSTASERETFRSILCLLLASTLIVLVGAIDDRYKLRGRQKLAGQFIACLTLVLAGGLSVQQINIWNMPIELGILAVPFTIFWLLGAINALNLIDGADGMAATVGTVLSLAVALMAYLTGHPTEALIAACLAGAILGFLIFNFPPASIFLGDAGSMLIGLVLGTLAIRCSLKGPATVALTAPAALMTIPFLDSAAAILRRMLTGRSIYTTDRGHLHHCLLRTGIHHYTMLLFVAVLCLATSAGALISVYAQNELFALITTVVVISILVSARIFGHGELKLLVHRLLSLGESLVPMSAVKGRVRQAAVRLQGNQDWDRVWEILTDFAARHELCYLKLDINAAWLHEGYHGIWRDDETGPEHELWTTRLPLATKTRVLGRLELWGRCPNSSSYSVLAVLSELLESLDDCLELTPFTAEDAQPVHQRDLTQPAEDGADKAPASPTAMAESNAT